MAKFQFLAFGGCISEGMSLDRMEMKPFKSIATISSFGSNS